MLWQLTFYKKPDAPRVDGFGVGCFSSLDEVRAVQADYAALPGFRDNPQGTWALTGHAVDLPADGIVWQVVGYNWSADGDERDLLYSPIFADRADAETCLSELDAHCKREHLEIMRIEVNRRWFAEGFDSE